MSMKRFSMLGADNEVEQNNPDTRRGRFIAPSADLSAPGRWSDLRMNLLMFIIGAGRGEPAPTTISYTGKPARTCRHVGAGVYCKCASDRQATMLASLAPVVALDTIKTYHDEGSARQRRCLAASCVVAYLDVCVVAYLVVE
jgi:hypothetical protein